MNKSKRLRQSLLYDNTAPYNKKDLDLLWLEYRIGKQYVCFGEFCDHIAAFNLVDLVFTPSNEYKEPWIKSGSSYWITSVERPHKWAEVEFF